MKVLVIHDLRRDDAELAICERELQRQGISEYAIWPAVTSGHDSVADCIAASHKNAIRLAKENDWDQVCIMESDVWFPSEKGWIYFLHNKPTQFDMYLAGIYNNLEELRRHASFRKSLRGPITLYNPSLIAGMHCYIMDHRYYDTFLDSPAGHIDIAQEGRGDFRICYPFAALQRRSWSANNRSEQDYNGELISQDVYGGLK